MLVQTKSTYIHEMRARERKEREENVRTGKKCREKEKRGKEKEEEKKDRKKKTERKKTYTKSGNLFLKRKFLSQRESSSCLLRMIARMHRSVHLLGLSGR